MRTKLELVGIVYTFNVYDRLTEMLLILLFKNQFSLEIFRKIKLKNKQTQTDNEKCDGKKNNGNALNE